MNIREMNVSARAKSCLISAGYTSTEEVLSLSEQELLSIKNLNQKCVDEIREALRELSDENQEQNTDDESLYSPVNQSDSEVNDTVISASLPERSMAERFAKNLEEENEERSDWPIPDNFTENDKELLERAKSSYQNIEQFDLRYSLGGIKWPESDIERLIKRDTMLLLGAIYYLCGKEERNKLNFVVKVLFRYNDLQWALANFLGNINTKVYLHKLYKQLPSFIGLLYEYDKEHRTNFTENGFSIICDVLSAIDIIENAYAKLIIETYIECCYYRLILSGKEIDKPSRINECDKGITLDTQENYSSEGDSHKAGEICHIMVNFIEKENYLEMIDYSKKNALEESYTPSKLVSICNEINDWWADNCFHDMEDDLDDIGVHEEVEESESFTEMELENDNSIKSEFEETISILEKSRNKVDSVFGSDCFVKNQYESKVCEGSIVECLSFFKGSYRDKTGVYFLEYGYSTQKGFKRKLVFGGKSLPEVVMSIMDENPNPFDVSVLPKEYVNAEYGFVNEQIFNIVESDLKRIENRYSEGIMYDRRYINTDWESELCYEQGKFLEKIMWNGCVYSKAPQVDRPFSITYSKMNKRQLEYYLFWRTEFRNGHFIYTGVHAYYYLCIFELLAEMGDYTVEERLSQLESLAHHCRKDSLHIDHFVTDYKKVHGYETQIEDIRPKASNYSDEKWKQICEIADSNYDNAFEFLNSRSNWRVKNNAFTSKYDCTDDIKRVVTESLYRIDKVFEEHDLHLPGFLTGYERGSYNYWPYGGTIWTERVIERVAKVPVVLSCMQERGTQRFYGTQDTFAYGHNSSKYDRGLIEYILRLTEINFREYFSFGNATRPTEIRSEELSDLGLAITQIINQVTSEYIDINVERLDGLKKAYEAAQASVEYEPVLKNPGYEGVVAYVNDSLSMPDCKGLVDLYEQLSNSIQKEKANKLSQILWEYWIISGCSDFTYETLKSIVIKNHWSLEGKKAVLLKDYEHALLYLTGLYNPLESAVSKHFSSSIIADSIILTLKTLEEVAMYFQLDITEMLLGKWVSKDWKPFSAEEGINYKEYHNIFVNFDDVEIYKCSTEGHAVIETYDSNEEVQEFVIALMKMIDGELRKYADIKSSLKIKTDQGLFVDAKYKSCLNELPRIVERVVQYVLNNNKPRIRVEELTTTPISIVHGRGRSVIPTVPYCLQRYYSVSDCIDGAIKEYYGINSLKTNKPEHKHIIEVDLSSFNISKYYVESHTEETFKCELINLNLSRFYELYSDLQTRLRRVVNSIKGYDPSWNYKTSIINRRVSGLTGKDLTMLTEINNDEDGIGQWIAWFEKGRFIAPDNQPCVQILFDLAVNRRIFKDNPEKCLIMLCAVCNYYFDTLEKCDQSANMYYEWLMHYWLVYCPDIKFSQLKNLLKLNVEFAGENNKIYASDHYLVDLSLMKEGEFVSFFNQVCDYKVVYGPLIKNGKRKILEKALGEVIPALERLWEQNGRNLQDDILYEYGNDLYKTRPLFYRCILLPETKESIVEDFIAYRYINEVEYDLEEDRARNMLLLGYDAWEVNNNPGRLLLEYILKQTENVIRKRVGINSQLKTSEKALYDLYSDMSFFWSSKIKDEIERVTSHVCDEMNV